MTPGDMDRTEGTEEGGEHALRESERKYRTLVEATGTGYVILDADGRVLDANAEYLRLTGRRALAEILGARVTEWTSAHDAERNAEAVRTCLARGVLRNFEVDYIAPDGGTTPIEINASVLATDEGTRILSLCRDITARRKLERSLREMESIFTLLLEHCPVHIFFKDADLRPIFLSRNFEQLLGRPLDQILGRTMGELFPPGMAEAMIADDRRVLERNTLVRVDEELGGKHYTTLKFPVPQEGAPPFLAGFTVDVTEQKKAEKDLRESEARFRAIFEQAAMGMALVGLDGRFLKVNPAFQSFLGHSEAELLALTFGQVTHPDFRAQDLAAIEACTKGEIPFYATEKRYLAKDGREPWGRLHVRLVRGEREEPGYLVAIVEDITEWKHGEQERKRLEVEVQHAQKLESLGSLAGGVAHDMNNILQAIQGMASVLKVKSRDPDISSGLDIILSAGTRGRDLVKDLTDFARKGLEETRLLDLNQLVRKEVELLGHTTLQRIELQMDLEEPLPEIKGDASAISNALMNLCVNAIDAMEGKGWLRFRTRRTEGGQVELVVTDSGHGMTPEILDHAMDPFFTTKPTGKGTGLGLSGVYGTMKAHGGSVDLQSEPGKGTQVSLRFPTPEEPPAPPPPSPPSPSSARTERTMKILLIDDDDLIRDSFPDLMAILGHEVVGTAANGADGLRRIKEGLEVDAVMLDHNMPGLSGLETLAGLRELRPALPIVFCTGHLDDVARERLKGQQKVWILLKPYTIKDIRPLLDEVGQA